MSNKYPKTSTDSTIYTTEYDVKIKGVSDKHNLSELYPKTPELNGYDDHQVIEIAKKILKSKNKEVSGNPDFPEGIVLDYNHKELPDQLDIKQVASGNSSIPGEGYAPLPKIVEGNPVDDISPTPPASIPSINGKPVLDNLSNVKKSSLNSNIEVGDVLLKGKSQKANIDE